MKTQWTFRKDLNHKWYLIPFDLSELFTKLVEVEDITILADEFDDYLINDIQNIIFESPLELPL